MIRFSLRQAIARKAALAAAMDLRTEGQFIKMLAQAGLQ